MLEAEADSASGGRGREGGRDIALTTILGILTSGEGEGGKERSPDNLHLVVPSIAKIAGTPVQQILRALRRCHWLLMIQTHDKQRRIYV